MIRLIKENRFIALILLLIIVFSFILLLNIRRSNITFYLMGNENMVVIKDSNYIDPLFVAYDKEKNIKDYVSVSGYVNTSIPGTYELEYVLDYKNYNKKLTRYVSVINGQNKKYEMVLNGSDVIYVLLGNEYLDKGAYVINTENGSRDNNVSIDSNVNINVLGEYSVKYTYNSANETISANRKVIVFDLAYSTIKSGDDMKIIVSAGDVKDYFYTRLPDGKYSYDNKVSYLATSNDNYQFSIYDLNGNVYDKKIKIDNIIKDYYCTAIININGTTIRFDKGDSNYNTINEYRWVVNGVESVTTTKSITLPKVVNNAMVTITTSSGQKHDISCSIMDNLAYHFNYVDYNNKPFMSCNTYSSSEKITLDNKLASAVSKVGYGTRAGVVEAARFAVGGLDYKIPYLGPKTIDYNLGRYPYKGLNIGSNSAWGCYVSGWLQGIDCVNFISWAFIQNGLSAGNVYSEDNTDRVRNVVNTLKVGDFLLTPCEMNCTFDFQHVGIIIGIDDNYIYVAEATTGDIDAVIVSKWDKHNMPTKGYFSVAKKVYYQREGNVTNMWLS